MKRPVSTRAWLLGPLAAALALVCSVGGANAVDQAVGAAGTDTTLPPTSSQVTINGRGSFSKLAITINQTKSLLNQAVSITWTGASPTVRDRYRANYLQIMQCWGDPDTNPATAVPANPGPPPEQCQFGAFEAIDTGTTARFPSSYAYSRKLAENSWSTYAAEASRGYVVPKSNYAVLPFRAANGTLINVSFGNATPSSTSKSWLNPYFNSITTNEVVGAVSDADGKGAELFEVQTGLESAGLGCGQKVQTVVGGDKKAPKCWIVVVPRDVEATDNVGTPFEVSSDGVVTSPLSAAVWKNRIAFNIEVSPVDPPCSFAGVERRVSGSELSLPAVSSWQPALCGAAALPPFSYAPIADSNARQQLTSGGLSNSGLVTISRPLSAEALDPASPVVYAPLTASGVVIGFQYERNPTTEAPKEESTLTGIRVAQINLTPRLVAKLLTQSYRSAVEIKTAVPSYTWLSKNANTLIQDPDFVQFNPEFKYLYVNDVRLGASLQLPQVSSDATLQLWEWILADPEAAAWLGGQPDQNGMRVNPVYNTSSALNPTGIAFATPLPSSFPKADPNCYIAEPITVGNSKVTPPPLCSTDWVPYNRGFSDGARIARVAYDGARIEANPLPTSPADAWKRLGPQVLGSRIMFSITDTPSASRYGVQMARLSRAGDNGPSRTFIAPNASGLSAGVESLAAKDEPTFLEPKPSSNAPGAYPLTSLVYAAVKPLALSASERSDYAGFLDYAATGGQVPGPDPGQLPFGYVPLPASLKAQVSRAAEQVRTMTAPTTTVPPTTTPPTTAPANTAPPPATAPPQVVTVPRPVVRPVVTTPVAVNTTTLPIPVEETTTTVGETVTTVEVSAPTTAASVVGPAPTLAPVLTPASDAPSSRFAIVGAGALALGSALGALEITKRPRRARSAPKGGASK